MCCEETTVSKVFVLGWYKAVALLVQRWNYTRKGSQASVANFTSQEYTTVLLKDIGRTGFGEASVVSSGRRITEQLTNCKRIRGSFKKMLPRNSIDVNQSLEFAPHSPADDWSGIFRM
jgi:hypothetical protein